MKDLEHNSHKPTDGLHPHILKSCAATVTKPWLLLTQQSMASESLPDLWRKRQI